MVLTVLTADVEEKSWQVLKDAYEKETSLVPEEIYQTLLIQSKTNRNSWQILTQWRSQEDLDKMRQSTSVPLAVKIFRTAGANPVLGIWDISVQQVNKTISYFK